MLTYTNKLLNNNKKNITMHNLQNGIRTKFNHQTLEKNTKNHYRYLLSTLLVLLTVCTALVEPGLDVRLLVWNHLIFLNITLKCIQQLSATLHTILLSCKILVSNTDVTFHTQFWQQHPLCRFSVII